MPRREHDLSPAPEGYTIKPIDPSWKLGPFIRFAWVMGRKTTGNERGIEVIGNIKLNPIQAKTLEGLNEKIEIITCSGDPNEAKALTQFINEKCNGENEFFPMEIDPDIPITIISPRVGLSHYQIQRTTYFVEER